MEEHTFVEEITVTQTLYRSAVLMSKPDKGNIM